MVQKLTAFKFESMKKGPFYEVKVKIQNLKACISRAPAIFGTKTLWQSFHTILSNSWKNGWFCIIFRCFFALPKMVILLHKMEIVRYLNLKLFLISFLFFRIGIMHVVATNIIIWIRTLIKESLEEIEEYEVRFVIIY